MNEVNELRLELVDRWAGVHKKSLTTLLIMVCLSRQSMWSKEILEWLTTVTGWEITQRGLHRSLQRMTELGLIEYEGVSAAKTGAERKSYSLTEFGRSVAREIRTEALSYLTRDEFTEGLKAL
jgi:PadR family transcriptional regulator, regulatory protein PadR